MKLYKITQNDSDQRLDKFLKKLLSNSSISLIYKLNRKSKIKIKSIWDSNFWHKDNSYKLKLNDELKLFLNDDEISILSSKSISNDMNSIILDKNNKSIFNKNNIVYEDLDLLIVNKDAWINVHPWDYKTKESNLIYQVHDYLWNSFNSFTFKPSLIHRLDRDTSGLLLIWKRKDILMKLVLDFKNHTNIKKVYYAIVVWKLSRKQWTIKKSILRIENAKDENKIRIDKTWNIAITHYSLLKEHIIKTTNGLIILNEMEISIDTWRMHQIRLHMADLWNPILWDKLYWDKKINSFFEKQYWLKRHILHSWKMSFYHYWKSKQLEIIANIKKDILDFLNNIKKS